MKKIRSYPNRVRRGGVAASPVFCGGSSGLFLRHHSAKSWHGSVKMIVARVSFLRNAFRTVQELHPWQGCRKCDYPANTDNNVVSSVRSRTNKVEERRKLNLLFLPNQHPNRSPLESIILAESVLEKAEIGGRDIVRMAHKQRKDRWLCCNLGHEGRLGDLRRFAFSHRQRVGGENLLKELVQCSGRDPF